MTIGFIIGAVLAEQVQVQGTTPLPKITYLLRVSAHYDHSITLSKCGIVYITVIICYGIVYYHWLLGCSCSGANELQPLRTHNIINNGMYAHYSTSRHLQFGFQSLHPLQYAERDNLLLF